MVTITSVQHSDTASWVTAKASSHWRNTIQLSPHVMLKTCISKIQDGRHKNWKIVTYITYSFMLRYYENAADLYQSVSFICPLQWRQNWLGHCACYRRRVWLRRPHSITHTQKHHKQHRPETMVTLSENLCHYTLSCNFSKWRPMCISPKDSAIKL